MLEALLGSIARCLDQAGIPYMVIGGQAVLLYGEPRLTKDIDVTLGVGTDQLGNLRSLLPEMGLTPLVDDEAFTIRTLVLPCSHPDSALRVDLIFSISPYERAAIARAKEIEVGGSRVRFAAVEDLIIHKVIAGRPRDLEDVAGILLRQPQADQTYIRRWLAEFSRALDSNWVERFDEILKHTARGRR